MNDLLLPVLFATAATVCQLPTKERTNEKNNFVIVGSGVDEWMHSKYRSWRPYSTFTTAQLLEH